MAGKLIGLRTTDDIMVTAFDSVTNAVRLAFQCRCRQKKQESMGLMKQTFEQLAEENKTLKVALKALEQEVIQLRHIVVGQLHTCPHRDHH